MSPSALLHLVATLLALSGFVAVVLSAARRERGQPATILIGLFVLLAGIHALAMLRHLGVEGLDRLIDFGRLTTPIFWFFLIYSWLQIDASRRFVASEERFRLFMENNPAIAFLKDGAGRYIYGNAAWAQQFGRPIDELLGKTDRDLWGEETAKVFEQSDNEARSGKIVVIEERGQRQADESTRWFEVRKFPVPRPDGERLIGGVVIEVTDRKRALEVVAANEERYRLMFERSPLPMWVVDDTTLRFLDVNPAAVAHYGYSREEFLAMTLREIRPADDVPVLEQAIRSAPSGVSDAGVWRHVKKDGSIAIVSVHRDSITFAGRPAHLVVLHDVTEQRLAQQRHEQLEAELAQVKRLETVGTLAAGVAHDFSNLLTAMQGHLALAERALAADHAARRSIRTAEKVAQQGISMTRNLLTFAHQMPSAKQPCNLAETVADVMHLFRHLIPGHIDVRTVLTDTPLWVMADRTQLHQVLMNLLLNARDAMPQSGTLTVTVEPVRASPQAEPSGALLRFEDTGTGIDPQILERIFEPFFTTKPRGKGSGLGLAMVHGIVTDHGGRITAHSTVGVGTRFDIQLPLCPAPAQAPAAPKAPAVSEVVAARKRTVLLASPHTYVREIMVTSLESAGYPVRLLEDANDLRTRLEAPSDEVGVVVVDIDTLGGDEPLTLLRGASQRTPVIVITAETAIFLDEVSTPSFQFLPKPFQMSQLIQRVDRALGVQKAGEV